MRDPNRIEVICKILAEAWKLNPDMRLCQFLQSVNKSNDMFYIEDEETVKNLIKWKERKDKNE